VGFASECEYFYVLWNLTDVFTNYCRKMMSLHFLPHGKIPNAFANLKSAVWEIENKENRTMMRKLYNYMENTWINSLLWPPKVWSVFMQEVLKVKYNLKHSNDYIHSYML
jgi:hypothetical protein